MSKTRRNHVLQCKAKVALEALAGEKTIHEIAAKHQVHPNQMAQWCRQLIDQATEVFGKPAGSDDDRALMRRLDAIHTQHPFLGSRRLRDRLVRDGVFVNLKRIQRIMGIEILYPRRKTSATDPGHRIYPYLLRGLALTGPNQVWCADVTYIPWPGAFAIGSPSQSSYPNDVYSTRSKSRNCSSSGQSSYPNDVYCKANNKQKPKPFRSELISQ